jgi:hypothetical protein
MLQIGKMYLVKEYFWFLFPTKELAVGAIDRFEGRASQGWAATGAVVAKVLSERYKCNIFVVEPKTCVVLLEMDETEHCYKLLDCNGNIGWTRCWSFASYFELVKE